MSAPLNTSATFDCKVCLGKDIPFTKRHRHNLSHRRILPLYVLRAVA